MPLPELDVLLNEAATLGTEPIDPTVDPADKRYDALRNLWRIAHSGIDNSANNP